MRLWIIFTWMYLLWSLMQRGAAPFVSSQNQFIEQPASSDVMRPVMASVVSVIRLLVSIFAAPSSEGKSGHFVFCCLHPHTRSPRKKKDGEGTREREKVQCDRAVLRFHLLCIHKTLQGPPSTSLCPCCLFHSSFPSSIFSLLALSFSNTEQLPRVTITKQPLSYFLRGFYTELKIENGIAGRSQGDRSLQDGMMEHILKTDSCHCRHFCHDTMKVAGIRLHASLFSSPFEEHYDNQ